MDEIEVAFNKKAPVSVAGAKITLLKGGLSRRSREALTTKAYTNIMIISGYSDAQFIVDHIHPFWPAPVVVSPLGPPCRQARLTLLSNSRPDEKGQQLGIAGGEIKAP